jgi:hypothetical protein
MTEYEYKKGRVIVLPTNIVYMTWFLYPKCNSKIGTCKVRGNSPVYASMNT